MKISKIKLPSEAAIRMHFSISLFGTYREFLWKITVTECDFLLNLHVTFSNFEPLLQKFKCFIPALMNAEQLLLWITSRNFFCALKIWGKFSSGRINKPHVGRLQLHWELHCRFSRGYFLKRLTQYPQLFLWANLLLKVISLQEKSTGPLIFWRNKESKFLLDTLQSKKNE